MKIVWKDFKEPIFLDSINFKHKNNFNKACELFIKIDSKNSDVIDQDDVTAYRDMIALIEEESQHSWNDRYYSSIKDAFDLYGLISDRATNGAHFRLEDGRQIGPITNLDMLFEQAGDDAIILAYGVQTEAIPNNSPRRSFTKAALAKIRETKSAKNTESTVQVAERLTQVLLNQEKK